MLNYPSRQLPDGGPGPGRLLLVVGPSGVGKDSLIQGAREALASRADVVFPRRVTTRAPGLGGEDYIAVSRAEFAAMQQQGRFALSWEAHGLHYGVSRDIEDDLARGRIVVANVSRSVLDPARRRYPGLRIVSVTASPAIVEHRLRQRGRESEDDIAARLRRAVEADLTGQDVVTCANDGALADGVASFLRAAGLDLLAGDPVGNSEASA